MLDFPTFSWGPKELWMGRTRTAYLMRDKHPSGFFSFFPASSGCLSAPLRSAFSCKSELPTFLLRQNILRGGSDQNEEPIKEEGGKEIRESPSLALISFMSVRRAGVPCKYETAGLNERTCHTPLRLGLWRTTLYRRG